MLHCSLLSGEPIEGTPLLTIRSPYDGAVAGEVTTATRAHTLAAVAAAVGFRDTPTRYRRSAILDAARVALEARREEFARTITAEAGLALREARYEVGRTVDVLRFASMEALRDDGPDLAECKRVEDGCYASADYREGRRAFMEKRKPRFTGS